MSKNKSNQLARSAGGHKVFQPEISKGITETEKQKRILNSSWLHELW